MFLLKIGKYAMGTLNRHLDVQLDVQVRRILLSIYYHILFHLFRSVNWIDMEKCLRTVAYACCKKKENAMII